MENLRLIKPEQESSTILAYGREGQSLFIQFKSGIYEYLDVPDDVFFDFVNADSLGKYVADSIKGNYEYKSVKDRTPEYGC